MANSVEQVVEQRRRAGGEDDQHQRVAHERDRAFVSLFTLRQRHQPDHHQYGGHAQQHAGQPVHDRQYRSPLRPVDLQVR